MPLSNGLLLVRQNASFKEIVITDISSPEANSPFFFSQYISGTRSPRASKTNFLKEKRCQYVIDFNDFSVKRSYCDILVSRSFLT